MTFNYDYWANPDEVTEVTFFMPNGVLIILKYSITTTLSELKAVSSVLNYFIILFVQIHIQLGMVKSGKFRLDQLRFQ